MTAEKRCTIEVCLSPVMFPHILTRENYIVVLADILRATTSICYAFANGVKSIIPVATLEEAKALKDQGFLVASEQDGKKLDFADFGNSAFSFTREKIAGKKLVYCTTNGTRALEVAKGHAPIAIGSFNNITALRKWLAKQEKSIVILCSGWKNKFCLEDTLFAGALTEALLNEPCFAVRDDATHAAIDLWDLAKGDVMKYLEKAAHRTRLERLGLDEVLSYSFMPDKNTVVPVFEGTEIRDVTREDKL
jgi:2-phosphosulfolactate phosphatase